MKKLLNEFITYLYVEKNYSKYTIQNYERDINDFLTFLSIENINNIIDVDYLILRDYLNVMVNKNYSSKTISRNLSSMRSFFKYLLKEGKIDTNPMLLISNPKEEKRLPKYLNYQDIERILTIPDKTMPLGFRDACILELLYSTGVRVSELVSIKIKDIDFSNRNIKIFGKGNKERIVLFGKKLEDLLREYLDDSYKLLNKKNMDYLFLNKYGDKITTRGIQLIIEKIAKVSELKFSISPHVFRHTFATHMLDNGADLNSVKELLGHENLNTTSIYTHVSNERLRKVYLDSHPRARGKGV